MARTGGTPADSASPAGPTPVDRDPGFSRDLTDGRKQGEWRSWYSDKLALKRIRAEAIYIGVLLVGLPLLLAWIYLGYPQRLIGIPTAQIATTTHYALVYVAGMLGGTLFTTKWLYHSVSTGWWNADRTLWRIFSPLLSGGIAFALVLLIATRVLPVLGSDVVASNAGAVGVAVFVGYFSDKAAQRLAQLANRLFGGSEHHESQEADGAA